MEKTEVLNVFFASVFTSKISLQESQVPETTGNGWSKHYVLVHLSKFADDTKLEGMADSPEGHAAIQRDLDRLNKCADRNLMKVKKGKCKVLHLGRKNLRQQYMLGGTQLGGSLGEKDLGVLHWRCHTWSTVSSSGPPLYGAWTCWRESNEEPQRSLRDWSTIVQERLRQLGPFSTEKRKLREDLINIYNDRTRGSGHKLKHRSSCLNIRNQFFTVRVTDHWHRLPREVVESPSLETFKSHLCRCLGCGAWLCPVVDQLEPAGTGLTEAALPPLPSVLGHLHPVHPHSMKLLIEVKKLLNLINLSTPGYTGAQLKLYRVELGDTEVIGAKKEMPVKHLKAHKGCSSMKETWMTAQLKCLYTNARSMGNKQEELEAIVHQENYDIVAITETWWDDSHNWSAAMDGYKLFRRDRRGRRGLGLELNDGDDRVECLWVRIRGKANKADIVVEVCYRPPNQDDEADEDDDEADDR
ncbi:hypothetical protein QYF61_002119 [Mycteria americana]|uniref:Rna-directed dna polymerase from mobile element jockey-like n=1 Tax=Mycteria americana TaxID=33587 RepID=A0AAN7PB15_MYCAM|nr:hypothetical protein QYF61_002119 [Mycteria americana]